LILEDVIGSYLDSLSEREFDQPFLALLRNVRFDDIHFLHGPFEFGKDFIAKRDVEGRREQFAFQTKSGDLDLAAWRLVRGQVDEMLRNTLAHPNFDKELPRKAVLVTTGRLIGGASVEAQEYGEWCAQNLATTFEVWDRETLVDLLARHPDVGLAGRADAEFLGLVAAIERATITDKDIETFSRRWITSPEGLRYPALEAAVVTNRLRLSNRIDLAAIASLCLLRGAWSAGQNVEPIPDLVSEVADMARGLFRNYAFELWERIKDGVPSPSELFEAHSPGSLMAYPVRCLRIVEVLGLLGLLVQAEDGDLAEQIRRFLCDFVASQPGAAHPSSDRWAVSIIPPALLMFPRCRDVVNAWLRALTVWIADRYEDGIGLAGPDADPSQEVLYLLGAPLEQLAPTRRAESYFAAVVLDLGHLMLLEETYDLCLNDFLAVEALPSLIVAEDKPAIYGFEGEGLYRYINVDYAQDHEQARQKGATAHHDDTAGPYFLERLGYQWDLLAIQSVLRDRHFVGLVSRMLA
jgi:hypothetical protein